MRRLSKQIKMTFLLQSLNANAKSNATTEAFVCGALRLQLNDAEIQMLSNGIH